MTILIIALCATVFVGQWYMSRYFGVSLGDACGFVPAVVNEEALDAASR
jgi:DNA-binding transcriptional regulator of glucitol operon